MKKLESSWQVDPIEPFIFPEAKVLILGTFPAPKARESGFYYAHPSNLFWKVFGEVFETPTPESISERKKFLKENKIALWNVVHACNIAGAKDSSIKDPIINDIADKIKPTQIQAIFTSGRLASKLYNQYCFDSTGIKDIYLPSTSASNRPNYPFDKLVECYKQVKEFLNE